MAKGDAQGIYVPTGYSGGGDPEMIRWVFQEMVKISLAVEYGIARRIEETFVAPSKPRDGQIAFADGTKWNPGSGRGFYGYYTGAWHFLG